MAHHPTLIYRGMMTKNTGFTIALLVTLWVLFLAPASSVHQLNVTIVPGNVSTGQTSLSNPQPQQKSGSNLTSTSNKSSLTSDKSDDHAAAAKGIVPKVHGTDASKNAKGNASTPSSIKKQRKKNAAGRSITKKKPSKAPSGHDISTSNISSFFQNPSYPEHDTEQSKYKYSVLPQAGYCALRIEFLEALLAPRRMGVGCSTDSMTIFNFIDRPSAPICGFLKGYQITIKQKSLTKVMIIMTVRSPSHLWRIRIEQIRCSGIKSFKTYFNADKQICGVRTARFGSKHLNRVQTPMSIPSQRLLQYQKKSLKYLMATPFLGSLRLLGQTVLDLEKVKIIRGKETKAGEYPWQAVVMLHGQVLCGAVIISKEWVLTAGHCVQLTLNDTLITLLTVVVGEHDLRTNGTKKQSQKFTSTIVKIVLHELNEGELNNIALIKLGTKLLWSDRVKPICLPTTKTDNFAGKTGIVTGWGKTDDWVVSNILRQVTMPIITNEKCGQLWSEVLAEGIGEIIDSRMVCAGGIEIGPCAVDPGGPLIVEQAAKANKWTLVGVASFGFIKGCAVSGVPVVYTRMSEYFDWLSLNFAGVT